MSEIKDVSISAAYRKKLGAAVSSILLFVVLFIVLVLLALALAAGCTFAGFALIIAKPAFITVMVGGGLAAMGILVFIFMVKFLFTRKRSDLSGMIEIDRAGYPELFNAIDEIVKAVGTSAPKKVYVSSNVNASVFYDSSFWSMILPVKKNLVIGMGLVHSTTVSELKAIISHEFGHFSQRSMKVGSYVYYSNEIIYNMLYDNESYSRLAGTVANWNGYFRFFVQVAIKVVTGIQWLLRHVYRIVNLNYLGLSREMEFHADHVAASVMGAAPLMDSLLRLDLADKAFSSTCDYYNGKIQENIRTKNFYPEFAHALNALGKQSRLPFQNGLPSVNLALYRKFNGTRIEIRNQWSSHPSIEDRIRHLQGLNYVNDKIEELPASTLFRDAENLELKLTDQIFEPVQYEGEVKMQDLHSFAADFDEKFIAERFAKIYNGYYDSRQPEIPENQNWFDEVQIDPSQLFSEEKLDLIYTNDTLENDLRTLRDISTGDIVIKSFDYDGQRFEAMESSMLIIKLEKELEEINDSLKKNDELVYRYFMQLAKASNRANELRQYYEELREIGEVNNRTYGPYFEMRMKTDFINHTTPFEEIEKNLEELKETEDKFRADLKEISAHPKYVAFINEEQRKKIEQYLEKEWVYFTRPQYDEDALAIMNSALDIYRDIIHQVYLDKKTGLLSFQENLENEFGKRRSEGDYKIA